MEQFITTYLLPLLGSLLAALASIAVAYVINWIRKKTGIDISQAREAEITKGITDAIWSAEEKAANATKGNIEPLESGIKYRWAIDFILSKFPELSREEADQRIHAMLGQTKGLGASGDMGA